MARQLCLPWLAVNTSVTYNWHFYPNLQNFQGQPVFRLALSVIHKTLSALWSRLEANHLIISLIPFFLILFLPSYPNLFFPSPLPHLNPFPNHILRNASPTPFSSLCNVIFIICHPLWFYYLLKWNCINKNQKKSHLSGLRHFELRYHLSRCRIGVTWAYAAYALKLDINVQIIGQHKRLTLKSMKGVTGLVLALKLVRK